jgi:HAE1 family hydrophobic/amphiphilic exporter-1
MLFGTVLGILVVPGLYYIFGTIASKGRKLIRDDIETPLSETVEQSPRLRDRD